MIKQVLWILCASICVLLLNGCYETDHPILDKGDKINLKGSYKQQSKIDGSIKTVTFTEQKEGFGPLAHYSYRDEVGDVALFKKLSSGLYLLQQDLQKEKRFGYVFVDLLNDETALILVADLMNKGDYIEALLKKNNIESESVSRSGDMSLRLKGSNKKILEFFDAHDKSLMTVLYKLEKKKNNLLESEYFGKIIKTLNNKWLSRNNQFSDDSQRAVVSFTVNQGGQISDQNFEIKSSDQSFNEAVIDTLKKSVPLPPIPSQLEKSSFSVGVVFMPNSVQ